jgi:regulatory protein
LGVRNGKPVNLNSKMIQRKKLTKEQAIPKIRHYCAYQERSQAEVKEKLYSLGLWKQDVEEITSLMIGENCLNEERFAMLFAGSKFRIKKWGKKKIKWELQQKRVSAYCIQKALESINQAEYLKTVGKLASAKWKILGLETSYIRRQRKLQDYLLQKGYEYEVIKEVIPRDKK